MKRLEMTGRTVFLTGGGGGIGREILRCFAECGANVIAPRSAELDLLSEDAIRSYFEQLPASPDILIHAAGINILAGMTEVTPEVMQRVFQVNVFSFASLIRYTVPHMTAQGLLKAVKGSAESLRIKDTRMRRYSETEDFRM